MNRLLNGTEAAAYCGLHIDNFKSRLKHGNGPHFVIPGKRNKFFRVDDLDAWVATWRDSRMQLEDQSKARISNQEYVDLAGLVCPSCRSVNIITGGFHQDGEDAHAKVCCDECPATWVEHFKLTGFSDLT